MYFEIRNEMILKEKCVQKIGKNFILDDIKTSMCILKFKIQEFLRNVWSKKGKNFIPI